MTMHQRLMTEHQLATVRECAALSASGVIPFGEIIQRLMAVGIERYHADYSRMETTFYAGDGSSCVVPIALDAAPIAPTFSPSAVESAVHQSQRGAIKYPEFTRQALDAGCVGYFVQIAGRCVQYFGRRGEVHTEWFPGARTP